MAFSMLPPDNDPEKVQRYLQEQQQQEQRERGGMMGGFRPDARTSPIAMEANTAGGTPRPQLPAAMPAGVSPPSYWQRPPSPTAPAMPAPAPQPGPPQGSPIGPMGARDPRLPDSVGAAGAAPAAAAGAAGGPIGMGAAIALQYLDQKRQQHDARRAAQEDIRNRYAGSLGYPQAELGAALANRDAGNMQGQDYLRYLLPFAQARG